MQYVLAEWFEGLIPAGVKLGLRLSAVNRVHQFMSRDVVERIACGIADAEGVAPEELSLMLERYVSTDAIRALLNHEGDSVRVQFEIPNHVVEVAGTGEVLVDGNQV